MIFTTEREAKEHLELHVLTKFCPLINNICRDNCICLSTGRVEKHVDKFEDGEYIYYLASIPRCTNAMFFFYGGVNR